MADSILISTKKKLGIDESYTQFDSDLIDYINTVFMVLYQMGVGTSTPFKITGTDESWDDFVSDREDLDAVRSFMALRVRKLFDPPMNSAVTNAINENLSELEWRLYAMENFEEEDAALWESTDTE